MTKVLGSASSPELNQRRSSAFFRGGWPRSGLRCVFDLYLSTVDWKKRPRVVTLWTLLGRLLPLCFCGLRLSDPLTLPRIGVNIVGAGLLGGCGMKAILEPFMLPETSLDTERDLSKTFDFALRRPGIFVFFPIELVTQKYHFRVY